MPRDAWIADEARATGLVVRRVLAHAIHRPGRLLVLALVVAGGTTTLRALRPPRYDASLYYRLDEGDLSDPSIAPRPPRAIREYISNVALSRDQVEAIMAKLRRPGRPDLLRDRIAAVEDFRSEINIEVSRNYFIYDRRPTDAPRSALVTISLSGSEPQRILATLHAIGDAITRDQVAQRTRRLAQAREVLADELAQAAARVEALRQRTHRLAAELDGAGAREETAVRVRLAAAEIETRSAVEQVLALERRSAAVAFSADAEDQQLALRFVLYDESLAASIPALTRLELARFAGLTFLFALGLAILMIGAFDDRVYAAEDLTARGMPLFGTLPRFPGDEAGSCRPRPC
jgi:hypothetical protein